MLAARAHKFELARSLYKRTGGAMDDQPAAMLLASAIDYQTGNAEQAVNTLQQLVALQPNNRKARRTLDAKQWKLGERRGNAETMAPIVARTAADSSSLSHGVTGPQKSVKTREAASITPRGVQRA